jgi:hypothetical protein
MNTSKKMIIAFLTGIAIGSSALQIGLPILKRFSPPRVTLINATGDPISDVTIYLGEAKQHFSKLNDRQKITTSINGDFGESSTRVSWTDSTGNHDEKADDYMECNGNSHSTVLLTSERKIVPVLDVTKN